MAKSMRVGYMSNATPHNSFLELSQLALRCFMDQRLRFNLEAVVDRLVAVFGHTDNKLMLLGNGGSAAEAQHQAAEYVVRFGMDRRPLPAIALTVDTSTLTACSNDYDFQYIFSRQIRALGREGDVLFCYSTSGTSANVLRAAEEAAKMGIFIVAFTGPKETELTQLANVALQVPSDSTARIQEIHQLLGHEIIRRVEAGILLDDWFLQTLGPKV